LVINSRAVSDGAPRNRPDWFKAARSLAERGLSAGVFKLGIGETILISFSVTPTTTVVAD
jgi:hypothetical protein